MSRDAALKLLGLDPTAPAAAIERALDEHWTAARHGADTAPTAAMREEYESRARQLEDAGRELLGASFVQPSAAASAPDGAVALREGRVLAGRYEVCESIGAGGMGAVYRAFDRIRDADIAIKVMQPRLLDVDTVKERFLYEARLSSELAHPNIVNAYDVQSDGELLFLTMELLQGTTLRRLMWEFEQANEPFPVERAIEITRGVCRALEYAHARTIHRDVKPENVFVCDDGTVKLMDFGISRAVASTTITITGAAIGTVKYMAPEQMRGAKDIDGRADQYSTALMLHEMLAGEVPDGAAWPLDEVRPDVDRALAAAVERGMELNREQRFASVREFAEALTAADEVPAKPRGRSVPLLPVALAALALFAVAAFGLSGGFGAGGAEYDGAGVGAAKKRYESLLAEWRTLEAREPQALAGLVLPAGFVNAAQDATQRRDADAAVESWETAREKLEATLRTARDASAALATRREYEALVAEWNVLERDHPAVLEALALPTDEAAAAERAAASGEWVVADRAWTAAIEHLAPAIDAALLAVRSAGLGERHSTVALGAANFALVHCASGTFTLGSPASEEDRSGDEAQRVATVGPFWIGATEVTQAQWFAVMESRPWAGRARTAEGERIAVTHVSFDDASDFCRELSRREREAGALPEGFEYRLPTEEEWEYACRAGTSTAYSFGDSVGRVDQFAVHAGNSAGHAAEVATKKANPWGLFDMHGNVAEWTCTRYDGGSGRVLRGGGWSAAAEHGRSAKRGWMGTDSANEVLGFRVVLAANSGG